MRLGGSKLLLTDTTTDKSTSDADLRLCSLVSMTPVCWKKKVGDESECQSEHREKEEKKLSKVL